METEAETTVNSGEKLENGRFKAGSDPRRNLNGRPKGSLDFKTKWNIFIDKVAKSNDLTPQDIDEQLFTIAFKKAKDGDYAFYRDLHDRLYGKPTQVLENMMSGTLNVYNTDTKKLVDNAISEYLDANKGDFKQE